MIRAAHDRYPSAFFTLVFIGLQYFDGNLRLHAGRFPDKTGQSGLHLTIRLKDFKIFVFSSTSAMHRTFDAKSTSSQP